MQRTETDVIKFYGHSLCESDYSYFQAIFDGVDLYAGSTKLIFLFKPATRPDGIEEPVAAAEKRLSDSVTKLLAKYGETMDNKYHGKNLMHTLLLEGRLSIQYLE